MSGAYPQEYGRMPAGDASMSGVLSALARRKWWILLATLAALAGALVFVSIAKPKYTGEAKVLLENRDNYFTRPDKEQRGSDPVIDAEAVQSQVQLIMSRDLAKTVIQKLDLGSREEFDPVKKEPSTIRRVLSLLGFGKDPLASSPEERILENFNDKLLVFNLGKSRVISVEFSSRDPELAARGANVIADEYIRLLREAKKSTTQGASAWLSQTIENLRAKVGEAEGRVEAFRAENGLLVGASNATIATQQLGEMNTQMSQARAAQTELQAKSRMIREALKTGRVFETSEVVNNELVRRLLEQRVAMKTQIALEERNLLPGHPRMKELNAQIADLESQIRTTAERTARTMENDARVAGARVQSLQAEFEGQKRTAATANESEVQLRALEREARALRDNYESYLAKYRDSLSRDSDAASPADARVVSRAVVPQVPTFPKKTPIILLATIATLVLSCAIVVTRQVFSTDESAESYPMPQPVEGYGAPSHASYEPAPDDFAQPEEAAPQQRPPDIVVDPPMTATQPAAAPMPEPVAVSVAEPVVAPVAKPAVEPVVEKIAEKIAEPVVEQIAAPVVIPPVVEPVIEPAAMFHAPLPEVRAPLPEVRPPFVLSQAIRPEPAPAPVREPAPVAARAPEPVALPEPVAAPAPAFAAKPYFEQLPEITLTAAMVRRPAWMPEIEQRPAAAPAKPAAMARRPARQPEPQPVAAPAPEPVIPAHVAETNAALAGLARDLAGLKSPDVGLIVNCHAFGADVATSGTSLPLARQMAKIGSTVYVDLAGARGDVEQVVGHFMAAGVTDILAGAASFGECIHRDRSSRLHIIPFGEAGFGDSGLQTEDEVFLDVLDALVQTYDFVLVDAGQLGTALDEAMHQAGAIVMVSSRDDTDPNVARVFQKLDAIRPGCVTIVVEEPMLPAPRPANDRFPSARGVA